MPASSAPIPPCLPQILVITPWIISIFYIITVVYALAMEVSAGLFAAAVGWGAARLPCHALPCPSMYAAGLLIGVPLLLLPADRGVGL